MVKQHNQAITGAWLVLGGSAEPPSTTLFDGGVAETPAELTPAECSALAGALLTWRASEAGGLLDVLRHACCPPEVAGGVVERWVAAVARGDEVGGDAAAGGAADRALLDRLGRDLRLVALPSARSVEAALLAGALELQREHVALQDAFDRRLAEAHLEAVRQLAYGAGHEINNPLANIATRGQSLLRDEPDPQRRRKLATIVDQAFRARDMIGGLMVFAKPPTANPGRIELREVVASVLAALSDVAVGGGVVLAASTPPQEVRAWADETLVAEALHAVVINALEAVAAGGHVSVTVASLHREGFHALVVADDGPGMELEEQAVACDPFHCGREAGRGLGIGLSKAWALMKTCGGSLTLTSAVGEGTAVTLELPVASADEAANSTQPSLLAEGGRL